MARTAVPVTAAALLLGLLPTQALALPPDPATEEVGRESLTLEELERDEPVPGGDFSRHLSTLKADVPEDLLAAPTGTVNPPSNQTGTVTFGSAPTRPPPSRLL